MIVQMMAVPPTQAAMTMSTVNVVRVILDDDPEGEAELLAEASDASVVTVTWALVGVATTGGVLIATMGVREVEDDGKLSNDDDDVLDEEDEEEELKLELMLVSGSRMLLRPKGSLAEDDGIAEAEEVLEEAGVCLEGAGVMDGIGVDSVAVLLDADGMTAVSVGGSAPSALAALGLLLPPPKSALNCG
jgi:hypothetical protein